MCENKFTSETLNVLKKYTKYNKLNNNFSYLVYYDKLDIIYTYIAKVGSSTFKKTFYMHNLPYDDPQLPSLAEDIYLIHRATDKIRVKPTFENSTAKKVLFLRNPYRRIVSAYLDKIATGDRTFANITKQVLALQRKLLPSEAEVLLNEKKTTPTFYELLCYLKSLPFYEMEQHFRPQIASICFEGYDEIFDLNNTLNEQWKQSSLSDINIHAYLNHSVSSKVDSNLDYKEMFNSYISDVDGNKIIANKESSGFFPPYYSFFEDEKVRKIFFEIFYDDIFLYSQVFNHPFSENYNQCFTLLNNVPFTTERDILDNLLKVQTENSIYYQLGKFILDQTQSLKTLVAMPYTIANYLRRLGKTAHPSSLGGKSFTKLIDIFEASGADDAIDAIKNEYLAPCVVADGYAALAKHTKIQNPKLAAQFAYLAYETEPVQHRLEFLISVSQCASDFLMVNVCQFLLPESKAFKKKRLTCSNYLIKCLYMKIGALDGRSKNFW